MSAGPEASTARVLPLWKRALFTLLPALVLLGACELVLRVAIADVEIRTSLAHGGLLRPYRPHAEADLVSADFRVRYRINESGFRDRPGRAFAARTDAPPPWRVLLLGDSFTEGYGVEQDETYARHLDATGRFESWNLARMGASPMFHIVMAREYVPRLEPDAVVVQLFDNDLDENRYRHLPRGDDGRVEALPAELRPGTGPLARGRDLWESLALVQAFDRLGRRLDGKPIPRIFVRPGSRIASRAAAADSAESADSAGSAAAERLFPWYDPARAPEWAAKFAEHEVLLRQLVGELREAKVPVVLAYAPHHSEIVPGDVEASRAANPHFLLLARLATELRVPLLDGVALFGAPGRDPAAYYYPRDQHWDAAGHALFAEALAPVLNALLGTPERPS